MPDTQTRQVEHDIEVLAPASVIYQLIARVENWPRIFPPTVHVEYLERGAGAERIRIWATANGAAKSWISRRTLDSDALRIEFRQEVSAPPVASMGGVWIIERLSDSASRVRLLHDYRAVDDDPDGLEWIDRAVDANSRSELAALKANIEAGYRDSELLMSFDDTVRIGGSAEDVYDFLNEAQLWTERLPHVAKVELTEDSAGLQLLSMDTRTKDGSTHTTTSVRVCIPHERIVYKQIVVPALMTLHTGYWLLAADGGETVATSQHTVVINPANITAVLGADADLAAARDFVRTALSGNSRATLGHAKEYAESRAREHVRP
ncbi:aromatase/cyclase [Nocardia noduli]|uniref:aromatase/cyclase n=1 Tax=Nocardia noduli TaxID=2815722 RepID=UPI001C23488F|nr:aromatase/cyclase [Nocardia noduli]